MSAIDRCVRCNKPIRGPYSETFMGRVHGAFFNECANKMDAPGGPECACGRPSAFENGDCAECGAEARQ